MARRKAAKRGGKPKSRKLANHEVVACAEESQEMVTEEEQLVDVYPGKHDQELTGVAMEDDPADLSGDGGLEDDGSVDGSGTEEWESDTMHTGFMQTGPKNYRCGSTLIDLTKADDDMSFRFQPKDIALEVECGGNRAMMYLSKLYLGSKGPCIEFQGNWITPNEFQAVSGRESAKDWKRSIRHHGRSLKLLLSKGVLDVHPAACRCHSCLLLQQANEKTPSVDNALTEELKKKATSTLPKKKKKSKKKKDGIQTKDKEKGKDKSIKKIEMNGDVATVGTNSTLIVVQVNKDAATTSANSSSESSSSSEDEGVSDVNGSDDNKNVTFTEPSVETVPDQPRRVEAIKVKIPRNLATNTDPQSSSESSSSDDSSSEEDSDNDGSSDEEEKDTDCIMPFDASSLNEPLFPNVTCKVSVKKPLTPLLAKKESSSDDDEPLANINRKQPVKKDQCSEDEENKNIKPNFNVTNNETPCESKQETPSVVCEEVNYPPIASASSDMDILEIDQFLAETNDTKTIVPENISTQTISSLNNEKGSINPQPMEITEDETFLDVNVKTDQSEVEKQDTLTKQATVANAVINENKDVPIIKINNASSRQYSVYPVSMFLNSDSVTKNNHTITETLPPEAVEPAASEQVTVSNLSCAPHAVDISINKTSNTSTITSAIETTSAETVSNKTTVTLTESAPCQTTSTVTDTAFKQITTTPPLTLETSAAITSDIDSVNTPTCNKFNKDSFDGQGKTIPENTSEKLDLKPVKDGTLEQNLLTPLLIGTAPTVWSPATFGRGNSDRSGAGDGSSSCVGDSTSDCVDGGMKRGSRTVNYVFGGDHSLVSTTDNVSGSITSVKGVSVYVRSMGDLVTKSIDHFMNVSDSSKSGSRVNEHRDILKDVGGYVPDGSTFASGCVSDNDSHAGGITDIARSNGNLIGDICHSVDTNSHSTCGANKYPTGKDNPSGSVGHFNNGSNDQLRNVGGCSSGHDRQDSNFGNCKSGTESLDKNSGGCNGGSDKQEKTVGDHVSGGDILDRNNADLTSGNNTQAFNIGDQNRNVDGVVSRRDNQTSNAGDHINGSNKQFRSIGDYVSGNDKLASSLSDSFTERNSMETNISIQNRNVGVQDRTSSVQNKTSSDQNPSVGDPIRNASDLYRNIGDQNRTVSDQNRNVSEWFRNLGDRSSIVSDQNRNVGDQNLNSGDQNRNVGDQNRSVGDQNRNVGDQNSNVDDQNRNIDGQNINYGDLNRNVGDQNRNVGDLNRNVDDLNRNLGDLNRNVGDRNRHTSDQNRNASDENVCSGDQNMNLCDQNMNVGDQNRNACDQDRNVEDHNRSVGDSVSEGNNNQNSHAGDGVSEGGNPFRIAADIDPVKDVASSDRCDQERDVGNNMSGTSDHIKQTDDPNTAAVDQLSGDAECGGGNSQSGGDSGSVSGDSRDYGSIADGTVDADWHGENSTASNSASLSKQERKPSSNKLSRLSNIIDNLRVTKEKQVLTGEGEREDSGDQKSPPPPPPVPTLSFLHSQAAAPVEEKTVAGPAFTPLPPPPLSRSSPPHPPPSLPHQHQQPSQPQHHQHHPQPQQQQHHPGVIRHHQSPSRQHQSPSPGHHSRKSTSTWPLSASVSSSLAQYPGSTLLSSFAASLPPHTSSSSSHKSNRPSSSSSSSSHQSSSIPPVSSSSRSSSSAITTTPSSSASISSMLNMSSSLPSMLSLTSSTLPSMLSLSSPSLSATSPLLGGSGSSAYARQQEQLALSLQQAMRGAMTPSEISHAQLMAFHMAQNEAALQQASYIQKMMDMQKLSASLSAHSKAERDYQMAALSALMPWPPRVDMLNPFHSLSHQQLLAAQQHQLQQQAREKELELEKQKQQQKQREREQQQKREREEREREQQKQRQELERKHSQHRLHEQHHQYKLKHLQMMQEQQRKLDAAHLQFQRDMAKRPYDALTAGLALSALSAEQPQKAHSEAKKPRTSLSGSYPPPPPPSLSSTKPRPSHTSVNGSSSSSSSSTNKSSSSSHMHPSLNPFSLPVPLSISPVPTPRMWSSCFPHPLPSPSMEASHLSHLYGLSEEASKHLVQAAMSGNSRTAHTPGRSSSAASATVTSLPSSAPTGTGEVLDLSISKR